MAKKRFVLNLSERLNSFMRPYCSICNQNLAAINYISNGKTRYRKTCYYCNKKGKKTKTQVPAWFKAGYRKRSVCDKCGFVSKLPEKQISVFYVDGNLKNNNTVNLKSVCLNCRVEISQSKGAWKQSPITPDF